MMEYSCFYFGPLGVEKKVSTLEDFVHFVDAEFDFSSFADVLPVCARDVITRLEFLHRSGIAHRNQSPPQAFRVTSAKREGPRVEIRNVPFLPCAPIAFFGRETSGYEAAQRPKAWHGNTFVCNQHYDKDELGSAR